MIAVKNNAPRFTPAEYFAWEEQQLERHEYMDGEVYAMSGGMINHGAIALNFGALLKAHMRGRGCKTLNSDCRVSIVGSTKYVYPDLSVTCDERDKTTRQYITYPCPIVEVLSPIPRHTIEGINLKCIDETQVCKSMRWLIQRR